MAAPPAAASPEVTQEGCLLGTRDFSRMTPRRKCAKVLSSPKIEKGRT